MDRKIWGGGGFWDFLLKNPSKLKKKSQKKGFDPQRPLPEYAPTWSLVSLEIKFSNVDS